MLLRSPLHSLLLATGSLFAVADGVYAGQSECPPAAPCAVDVYAESQPPSWVFRRGTYTHDPYTGVRVAQYMPLPSVEPLEDERAVTSRYRRSRTNIRGIDGSVDTYYEVQAWGNGRGGIDAEWERFHDAWKESFLQGGYYNQGPGYFAPWGFGGGYGAPGFGYGHGYPGHGYPGYGKPWHGNGKWDDRGHGGPHHGGPPHGGHGGHDHDGHHGGSD